MTGTGNVKSATFPKGAGWCVVDREMDGEVKRMGWTDGQTDAGGKKTSGRRELPCPGTGFRK